MTELSRIKDKKIAYEKEITDIINQFAKELPKEIVIDSVVAVRLIDTNTLSCTINLKMEGL